MKQLKFWDWYDKQLKGKARSENNVSDIKDLDKPYILM